MPGPLGQVLWVNLPRRRPRGREQEGTRPCLLLADPAAVQTARYPVLLVAPLTRTRLPDGPLYPRIAAGAGGLPDASTILLDQLLTIDAARVTGLVGTLASDELEPVHLGLRRMFGL